MVRFGGNTSGGWLHKPAVTPYHPAILTGRWFASGGRKPMESSGYWGRMAARRIGRRRVLKGGITAGAALAGLAAAGCAETALAPTAPPAPTSAGTAARVAATSAPAAAAAPTATVPAAKYGGTISWIQPNDAPHLDVHQTTSGLLTSYGPAMAYSKLLK